MNDRPWPPTPGFYIYRKYLGRARNGRPVHGPDEPCLIWYGPPIDWETGEEMERSARWQAMVSGYRVEIDNVWPWVAGDKITQEQYDELRREHHER